MPYELKKKVVTLCGETLIVYQASNEMDVERTATIDAARQAYTLGEDTKEQYVFYVSSLLYPSLVSCTKGNVPTLDQFMRDIPQVECDVWIEAARDLNPQWFRFLLPEDTDEKKEEQLTSSTPA
jgi:hypothetical protein